MTRPTFVGIENIPDERPLLFVGNHTLFGLLDVPLMFFELWKQRGIFLRGLGDHIHFKVPVWGEFLRRVGVVDGTRENCAALMRDGEAVLVFPGGAREVLKRKGERYQLIWKNRLGFAKMALRHRCTIVPFGAVGADDAYDIVIDGDDVIRSPLGKLGKRLGILHEDLVVPLARGAAGTPLPKPQRFYFRFEPPIPTAEWAGRDDEATAREVRDRTRSAVEHALDELLALRARTRQRS
jgi:1-acyl-sn-glycerol-3-phosphate acyltransferase